MKKIVATNQLLNGVYLIRNLVTQDCYIGSAAGKDGFKHRFDRHLIRRLVRNGITNREIAIKFGVSETAISNIRTGRTWSRV